MKAKEKAFYDDEFDVNLDAIGEPEVKEVATTGKKRGRKKKAPDPRINMAFYEDNLKFLQYAAWKNRQSITQYVNGLVTRDKENYNPEDWENFDEVN